MNFIFHATLPPRIVSDDEYIDYLETGEWFDRQQTETQKGNLNENYAKRLRNEEGKGNQSEHESFGNGYEQTESEQPMSNASESSREASSQGQLSIEPKRRGRRPKS